MSTAKNSNFCFNRTKVASIDGKAKRILLILMSDGKDVSIKFVATHNIGTSCSEPNIDLLHKKEIIVSKTGIGLVECHSKLEDNYLQTVL